VIDTIHTVETPEGVALDLRVAGPAIRLLAWMIDVVVQLVAHLLVIKIVGTVAQVSE